MGNKDFGEYYLGLDMGTSSVGWAVTDEKYQLLKAKGKDMWGIREFDEAQTAVDRRTHRIARRRRQREVARIGLLKDYFHDEIAKIDPNFYQRLENSKYHTEDKDAEVKGKYGVFNDKEYTDKEYYAQYPTIYHLRKELLHSTETHDVRLVYLALLNMFKHRGHFLNANLSADSANRKLSQVYMELCDKVSEIIGKDGLPCTIDDKALENLLGSRDYSRSKKAEEIAGLMGITSKEKDMMCLIKGFCGLNIDAKQLFGEQLELEEKLSFSFSDYGYEEKVPEIMEKLGEERYEIIALLQEIYNIGALSGIMKGYEFLSDARVEEYKKHKEDLQVLKRAIKKHCTRKEYEHFFRSTEKGTYSAYVNTCNTGKKYRRDMKDRSREVLYKLIKKLLNGFEIEDKDVEYILLEISKETFLPKQLTASNGIIPNQVHEKEMVKILKNAEGYLPFLKEVDETGLSVKERIIKLFKFQIPYYVGPTTEDSANHNGNGWVVRKEAGKVFPWNLEQKIDLKKTSEEFIARMVRKCSYLSGNRVLPKASLEYQSFCVLNEINNIKVAGEKISVEMKQDIYHALFKKGKRVSKKEIIKYLTAKGVIGEKDADQVSGIDNMVNSSLSTYGKFFAILKEDVDKEDCQNMIEDIVFWCTVYGDSKKFLREQLEEKYSSKLTQEQIKRILGMKFRDWGNLSKEFLELNGCSKGVGEQCSLIRMMWESNHNLMELLSRDKFTYIEELERLQVNVYKPLSEMTIEDLDDMYFSAPVKRMVWQTLLIIKEIEQITGHAPKRVFIEMTRKEDEKKKRTDSRKKQLLDLYKSIKNDEKNWADLIEKADQDGTLRSKKVYLYLTQMGRCMYTGRPIELEDLFNDNLYDIDHIYPRHYVKDDNLNNNLVLVAKSTNAYKSDHYPIELSENEKQKCWSLWKELHEKKLINDEKYRRLTGKNPFTDEQKADFIARQLVETSQGTKGVATLLRSVLPEQETSIVYAKASNVSDFRNKRGLLKSRIINDFHHAQDAYLNIVVGNVYYVKFTNNPLNFIKKEYARDAKANHYNLDKMFDWDVKRGNETAWISQKENGAAGTISTVKKMMAKNTPILTRRNFEAHGGIADQTLYSAKKACGEGYISLKSSDEKMKDVTKYGGFSSVATAYYFLVEHGLEGKRVRTLETVPIYLSEKVEKQEDVLLKYCKEELGLLDPSVRLAKIKMQSYIKINGYYAHLGGKTGRRILLKNAVQLCLKQDRTDYIKKLENYQKKGKMDEEISIEKNIELYDELLNKHKHGIYRKRPNPVGLKLEKGKEKFDELSKEDQIIILLEILKLTKTGKNLAADLKSIGESAETGIMRMNQKISDAKEIILINQSVTGLYEKRIDLLTV